MKTDVYVLCEEIKAGKTENDKPYIPPFMLGKGKMVEKAKEKELGDAVPMEHFHKGMGTTVKYNAKKIFKGEKQL